MTTKETKGQHVIELRVTNYMGVKVGAVRPNRKGTTYVGGKNGAAKTGFLSGIEAALGDKRFLAQKPIREGEEVGEVDIELDDFIIRWEVRGERTTKLTVFSKELGYELKKPATVLAKLFGPRVFNALGFARMDDSKQREAMISLAPGLADYLAELVARRAKAFETRTEVNRNVKTIEGSLTRMEGEPFYARLADIPDEPVSAGDIAERIKAAEAKNLERLDRLNRINGAQNALEDVNKRIEEKECRIAALRFEIADLETEKTQTQERIVGLTDCVEPPIDTAEMIGEFDKVTETNDEVRHKQEYLKAKVELGTAQKRSDTLTKQLEEVDGQKHEAIKAANFPVEGVDFSDDGVTFNGLPFDQASQTEQILTSFAIESARNPPAKFMIVYEASLMDDEHLDLLHKLAVGADVQVLAEYVTRSQADEERCAIVFVDGVGTAK